MGRILRERLARPPDPALDDAPKSNRIVAKYPNHVWHADLTVVPISGGFWTNWIPHALWQRWPVCWWVLNVVDHFSRRSMGFAVFKRRPDSEEVTDALSQIARQAGVKPEPKYLIVDQGPEFKCEHFEKVWCPAMNIQPRFGAVGRRGSVAVVERFHRTLKELLRQITIAEEQSEFEREVALIIDWYNEYRPHDTLGGRTPNEVHFSRSAANEQPRFEPRPHWPRGSPCAKPQVNVKGEPGDPIILEIDCLENRPHLPIIRARHAA